MYGSSVSWSFDGASGVSKLQERGWKVSAATLGMLECLVLRVGLRWCYALSRRHLEGCCE